MTPEQIQDLLIAIAKQGSIALLAAVIFYFYRKDSNDRIRHLVAERDLLIQALKEATAAMTAMKVVSDNVVESLRTLVNNCRVIQMFAGGVQHHHEQLAVPSYTSREEGGEES